jgi:hypothetical protein
LDALNKKRLETYLENLALLIYDRKLRRNDAVEDGSVDPLRSSAVDLTTALNNVSENFLAGSSL